MLLRTLILNQRYRPHEVIHWRDAVTRMFNGKIEVVAQYDEILAHLDAQTLHTFPDLRRALRQVLQTDVVSFDIKVPAVAVIHRRVSMIKGGVKFSKPNVCLRDDFSCQYCGQKLPMSKLNYDHVKPRRYGGQTTWENIVVSCYPCNDKKGGRTPDEAGMRLLSVPVKPKVLPMNEPLIDLSQAPAEWEPFITRAA